MTFPSHILAAVGATLLLAFGGCSGGDSREKLVDEIAMQMDRMATALGSVADKASAERAMTDMKAIVGEMKKIAAHAKALGQPGADLRAKLDAKLKAKVAELQERMAGSQASLVKAGPEATGIIIKGMLELAPAMDEIAGLFKEEEKNRSGP